MSSGRAIPTGLTLSRREEGINKWAQQNHLVRLLSTP